MEWIKIKFKHIWFLGYTDSQIATLVKIQTLTAILERAPTESELLQNIHKSSLISLEKALNMQSISLQYVINKVLEDVQSYQKRKEKDKIKKAQQRQKLRSVPGGVPCDVPQGIPTVDKIREDEIREEKIREEEIREEVPPGFTFLFNTWISRNKEMLRAYPGHKRKFRVELSNALKNGWTAETALARIMEVGNLPPWEVFKKKKDTILSWRELLKKEGKYAGE